MNGIFPAFIRTIDANTTVEQFEAARAQEPNWDLSYSTIGGKHILHQAAETWNAPLVDHIVKNGGVVLVNQADAIGQSPLYYACLGKTADEISAMARAKIVGILLGAGADVNAAITCKRNGLIPFGSTPLWAAAHKAESAALATLLLRYNGKAGTAAWTAKGTHILQRAQKIAEELNI